MVARNHELKLYLKLTAEELGRVKKKAQSVNMSMTNLARALLLNAKVQLKIET
jgi:hypothetical protein